MNAPFKPDALPEWNLADLYAGRDDPKIEIDLAAAKAANDELASLEGLFLQARGEPERLGVLLDRGIKLYEQATNGLWGVGAYAGLAASTARDDPAWAKFEADLRARSSAIAAESLFFSLELNQLEDRELEAALQAHPAAARWTPWLRRLRLSRPHELTPDLERYIVDRGPAVSNWVRLYDETLAKLTAKVGEIPLGQGVGFEGRVHGLGYGPVERRVQSSPWPFPLVGPLSRATVGPVDDPGRQGGHRIRGQGGQRHLAWRGRGRPQDVDQLKGQQQRHEQRGGPAAVALQPAPPAPGRGGQTQQSDLHHLLGRGIVPPAQPDLGTAEQQVRAMDQKVEPPVRQHHQPDRDPRRARQFQQEARDQPGRHRPDHGARQAMGVGHVEQHQRAARQARIEAQLLDARQDQPAPRHVDQLGAQHIGPERRLGLRGLGGQRGRIVSDEHRPLPRLLTKATLEPIGAGGKPPRPWPPNRVALPRIKERSGAGRPRISLVDDEGISMLKRSVSIALVLGLAVAPSAMAAEKPMGWFAQTVRSIVVFNSCTERLKEKFNIGPLNGIDVTNMDAGGAQPSGAMDVKFEVTTTEKKSGRKSRFSGVCHVGREGETRIDARLISQQGGGDGVVRRVPPGKIAG